MRIQLTEERTIKSKLRKVGETVIVNKELGERLISEGMANRIVGAAENRVVGPEQNRFGPQRFSGHKIFGRH